MGAGGFLSSIFTGSSPGLSTATNNLNSLAGYTSNTGQTDTNAASKYNLGILSGDPTQIAETLSPEIAAGQQQAQQEKNTMAQFANRGGGTNSAGQAIDDSTRGKIIQLIGQLRQGAAGQLGQLGTANLGMSTQNNVAAGQLSEEQLQNMINSIFGQGIAGGLLGGEGIGLGAAGKAAGLGAGG